MFQQEIDRENGYRPGVGLLLIRDGRILLGRCAGLLTEFCFKDGALCWADPQPSWQYSWDIPQGGIEIGESFRQAIRREADEELGDDWCFEMVGGRPFRQEKMDFPVNKDGRTYRGKTYYFHLLDVTQEPFGYADWAFGPHGDEDPRSNPYPAPGFPGGVVYMGYGDARGAVLGSQNGRKGQLILSVLDDLRYDRLIRP